jgi:hypothetical protein
MSGMPIPAYAMGARVRYTPPFAAEPHATPYIVVGRMVTELFTMPARYSYVLKPYPLTDHGVGGTPLVVDEAQLAPWPEDPPRGEETSHAQSVKHDCPMGQSDLDDQRGGGGQYRNPIIGVPAPGPLRQTWHTPSWPLLLVNNGWAGGC